MVKIRSALASARYGGHQADRTGAVDPRATALSGRRALHAPGRWGGICAERTALHHWYRIEDHERPLRGLLELIVFSFSHRHRLWWLRQPPERRDSGILIYRQGIAPLSRLGGHWAGV